MQSYVYNYTSLERASSALSPDAVSPCVAGMSWLKSASYLPHADVTYLS